jgi:hypothetical protein
LIRELPGTADTWRWEVRNGTEVAEAIGLRPHALLWPGAREGFARIPDVDHPAWLPVLARDALDGAPVRVRPPTRPFPRLDATQAAACGRFLAPAVLLAAGAARGEVRTDDLVVDADGVPRFAPLGFVPPDAIGRVPYARAPEVVAGAPPDGASDLYGLGVACFTAVRGEPPWPAPSLAALDARRGGPAPTVGLIDADALLSTLLAVDPSARRGAVGASTLPPRLPDAAPAVSATPTAVTTRPASPPLQSRSTGFPRYVVLVPTARLSHHALAVLASRSERDAEAVRAAARTGARWAVGGAEVEADARTLARRFAALGLPADVDTTVPPRVIQYLVLAAATGMAALLTSYRLPFAVGALVLVYMALVNFRAMFRTAEVRMAWQARDRATVASDSLEGRLIAARERAERLPEVAAADLRVRLDEARRALEHARGVSWSGTTGPDEAAAAQREAELAAAEVARIESAVARAAAETS